MSGRGQDLGAEAIGFESNALLENQVRLEGFERFIDERPEKARVITLGCQHAVATVAHEIEITGVHGDLRLAQAPQFSGAAGGGTVAMRQQNQGELIDFHPVVLECREDAPQIPGIDQHGFIAEQEITVGNRAFDSDEHGRLRISNVSPRRPC